MKITTLGRSDLRVSAFCLGTMTWGSQNTVEEAHAQIDLALERGVNLMDTAEMYPTTPMSAETAGATEEILGQWVSKSGRRDALVLATKIVGPGNQTVGRDGARIGPDTLRAALEGSLRRLRTDCIDLYQLHWPNRGAYHFRRNWSYDPSGQAKGERDDMRAILETLAGFVAEGKVRHVGLSNETAWGTAAFLGLAEGEGLPRMISIQNEYSLLCRLFDTDLAELCHHEDVGLLAYSPLAAGLLSDKYREGRRPDGSRATINQNLAGRLSPQSERVAAAYADLARAHGLDPAQMALAFCASRPFMASVIVGATDLRQLELNLGAADLVLPTEVMDGIARLHRAHPLPI